MLKSQRETVKKANIGLRKFEATVGLTFDRLSKLGKKNTSGLRFVKSSVSNPAGCEPWSTTGNEGRGFLSFFRGRLCIDILTKIGHESGRRVERVIES